MSSNPTAQPAPPLGIPPSDSICTVSIIDTTCNIVSNAQTLIEPHIPGHDWLNLPTYAFLLEHKATGTRILFDMGCRTDFENYVPHLEQMISERVPGLRVDKEVIDILAENDVDMSSIKTLILSHWHFDHTGNIARLHPGTELLVGPGFRGIFLPGYPAKESSAYFETDFEHIDVVEVPFGGSERTLKLGEYQAYDYFGDGSLYVLNTTGHTVGHISALVRTTKDTFILMGGDVCHFPGVFRPTKYNPMPDPLPSSTILDKRFTTPCPCAMFTACHPDRDNTREKPFYGCSTGQGTWYEDPAAALISIQGLPAFDADPNILVLIAHDPAITDALPFFPHANVNDWQARGWKDDLRWHFVNELPVGGRAGRPPLVDGLYKYGKRVQVLHKNKVE